MLAPKFIPATHLGSFRGPRVPRPTRPVWASPFEDEPALVGRARGAGQTEIGRMGRAPEGSASIEPRKEIIERPERSTTIPKEDAIELEGTVSQVLGNGNFKVEVNESHEVLAQIAGKMRKHRIRVLPGDRVRIEVSPYDLSRGRITYRFRS